ncbi:MAG: CBS domain-containing protein [Rhizobiales bacterium]|nr:CBS domain-containing protein [Hyphomicrobiales bacterium]
MSVAQILSAKGRTVHTAMASDKLEAVAKTLADKRIGSVVITDGKGGIAGILSERDIVRAVARNGAGALELPASSAMTSDVRTCAPSDSEAELMAVMTAHRIRHLPVIEGGRLAGMISIGDVVKFRIEAIEREAEDMKSYIATAG